MFDSVEVRYIVDVSMERSIFIFSLLEGKKQTRNRLILSVRLRINAVF